MGQRKRGHGRKLADQIRSRSFSGSAASPSTAQLIAEPRENDSGACTATEAQTGSRLSKHDSHQTKSQQETAILLTTHKEQPRMCIQRTGPLWPIRAAGVHWLCRCATAIRPLQLAEACAPQAATAGA